MYKNLVITEIENYENMKLRDLNYSLSQTDALLKKRISAHSILPGIKFGKVDIPGVVRRVVGGESALQYIENKNKSDKKHVANILGVHPNDIEYLFRRHDSESGKTKIRFTGGYSIGFDSERNPVYSELHDDNLPSIEKSVKLKMRDNRNPDMQRKNKGCGVCCNNDGLKESDLMDFNYTIEVNPSGIFSLNYANLFCGKKQGYLLPDITSRNTEKNNEEFRKLIDIDKIREFSQEEGFYYDIIIRRYNSRTCPDLDIGSLQNKKMQDLHLKRIVDRIEKIQDLIEPKIDDIEDHLKRERTL